MIITRFSLKHFMAVLVLCLGIILIGTSTYINLPREDFPEVTIPNVMVTTVLDGANPEDVETSVTIPLETELSSVEGLKEMRSTSSESLSVVMMEFDAEVEMEDALRRVKDAVDAAKGDLPQEAEESIVEELSLAELFPILIYNLTGDDDLALSELKDLAERIQDELETLPGVLDVKVHGGREREILIEVDPERLHYYNLTLAQVKGILRGTNKNVSVGASDLPGNRLVMRAPGEFKSVADIFNLVVGVGGDGAPIFMKDVALVRYSFEDEGSRARLYNFEAEDGSSLGRYVEPNRAISIMISKKTGANVLDLVERCNKVVDTFELPDSVDMVIVQDLSKEVRDTVADLENGIGTSLLLVLAVIFVGLGVRNAVLVAMAIPFSMLISIIVINLMGYTLNNMILYSLILALGMLVDNAIVIIENIYRHHAMGMPRAKAALQGTSEVAWAVIASTATTVAAFAPVAFWPGVIGEFMSYLPITVIIVLTSSLFVGLVINPTLASLFMKVKKGAGEFSDPETEKPTYHLARIYGVFLDVVLKRPVWTLVTAFLMLIAVIVTQGLYGKGVEFFPALEPDRLVVSITPPDGTSLAANDHFAKLAEERILGAPDSPFSGPVKNLKHVGVTIGLTSGQQTGPASLRIEFVGRDKRTESSNLTMTEVRNRIEGLDASGKRVANPLFGAEYEVIQPEEGPPTGKPVAIEIFGEDYGEMTAVVRDMKELMEETSGVVKPFDDAATAQPTIEWDVDKARAAMVGLDQATVSSTLQMVVGGLKSGTFGHGDDEQDIIVRLPEEYRLDTRKIKSVSISNGMGGSVPITSVATANLVPGPVQIKHVDRKRVLKVQSDVEPWVVADADVRRSFQAKVAEYTFPPGVTHRFSGAAEEEEKATEFLSNAFMIAIFAICLVLVVQFNSIAVPTIVMCSVILSFIGVFLGLLIFQKPFGIIMSGIGVISLAGVVVNNGIVLLDAIRQFQRKGLSVREAVVTASMIRLRPVLLTAITTVLGLLPMALKFSLDFANMTYQYDSQSSQYWQSMAVVVIFGLVVSTALTLGVVPTLYYLYERLRAKVASRYMVEPTKELDALE
ncbi:MAG: AcrB/AcrD/AcrF family protein [Deltaproteobacteria bacterium]|nr:MAG: AcrB/AcrD/AcrF family protein [Deltaproteobacteria bacterium]